MKRKYLLFEYRKKNLALKFVGISQCLRYVFVFGSNFGKFYDHTQRFHFTFVKKGQSLHTNIPLSYSNEPRTWNESTETIKLKEWHWWYLKENKRDTLYLM